MTFRSHDHQTALEYANREALRSGVTHKVTIHSVEPQVRALGIGAEFHVAPVNAPRSPVEVIDEVSPGIFQHWVVVR